MSNIKKITQKYIKAIDDYEDYLKKYTSYPEPDFKNMSSKERKIAKDLIKHINTLFENDYLPWRMIKSDRLGKLEKIASIFYNREAATLSYLRASDFISDSFITMAEEELTEYYKKHGKDVSDDMVKDKIIDEVFEYHLQNSIDSNIFSKQLIELHKISKDFNDVSKDLYDYYSHKEISNDEIVNEEIEY